MRAIAMALMVTGCSPSEPVTLQPKIECEHEVRCNVIMWQVGMRPGTYLGGIHMRCHCLKGETDD
jgi:hypothetical protein